MSNLTNPPILDNTGQDILSALANIKRNLPQSGGSADPSLHFDWSNQTLPQTGDTNTIYCIPTGDTSDPWDFYAWNDTDEEFVKIDFNMTISIDSALSDTSTNPVQNRVVKGAIDAKADNTQTFTEASTRTNIASGETFAVILGKIKKFFTDLKAVAFSGSYNDLSDQPTIPAAQVNSDWNAGSGVAQILNKPSSMPASDVYAWAKASTKPSYTASEVGALASNGTAVKATADADGNTISSTYMKKGVDYVTAGKKSGTTIGTQATAEGLGTTASKSNAHAEGYITTASGAQAHAEGSNTMASGDNSHSEGDSTMASGNAAHAEGSLAVASGRHAHAEGMWTKASSPNQHVEGKYNVEDANGIYAHIIGGGTSDSARKNIFTVDWNGDVNAGRSNGLTNDTKLPTGADVISYLNSNLMKNLGTFASQSDVEASLSAQCVSLPDVIGIDIFFVMSAASGIFLTTGYIGRLFKINSSRASVLLFMPMQGRMYRGNLNGTWTWDAI